MSLSDEQRKNLDYFADFTEDTFLQPQYASVIRDIFVRHQQLGAPIHADDAAQWALEREWTRYRAGTLAGIAFAVEYMFDS
jgi:hypothetical protein